MTTNRQRFMMDNHDTWIEEIKRRKMIAEFVEFQITQRKLERELIDSQKPLKTRKCSDLGCSNFIDITNTSIKRINEQTWKKCSGKNCTTWCCQLHSEKIILFLGGLATIVTFFSFF